MKRILHCNNFVHIMEIKTIYQPNLESNYVKIEMYSKI